MGAREAPDTLSRARSCLNKLNSLSLKILAFMLAAIVAITVVFSYMSGRVVQAIHYDFFSEKTLLINRIVAAHIDGEDILSYVEALRRDEAFKERQLEFFRARQTLVELDKEESDAPEERAAAEDLMRRFHREAAKFKDANYFRVREQLDELCAVSNVKYLYIFADTGIPGMYTYLFDALASRDSDETSVEVDADDLGTIGLIEEFGEAEVVFATKQPLSHAEYEANELYGLLYSAYAPLFDAGGNIVAVIGTDIELTGMNLQIAAMRRLNAAILLTGSCVFIFLFYVMLRRIVLKPIAALTDTAARIEDGRIYTGVPEWILKKNDEMGLLGKALSAMTKVFQEMLTDTKQIFDAVIEGRLDVRNDPSPFKGDVAQVIRQINDTLDIVSIYFDSIPEALFILNPRLEPVFRNELSSRLFDHLTPAGVVRKILSMDEADESGRGPEIDDGLAAKWNEALRTGFYTASAWLTTPEAKICFAFTCCDLILNGIKRGTLVVASDITDLMREKAKAQSASVAKDEFLSRVSHELRSPMNIIVGMAKLGLKDSSRSEPDPDGAPDRRRRTRERFENIDAASAHLMQIINDMLDMSRVEAGEIEIRRARFSIRKAVDACCDSLRPKAEAKGVAFACRIDPGTGGDVVGDEPRVSQVLANLLTNAIKFTDKGGEVTLSVRPAQPENAPAGSTPTGSAVQGITFSVEDTGVGMSEEFMRKIFTPFEQEDRYIRRRYQGTGLGLSICHRLVTLMGGVISVSSAPNAGSVFTFTLPFERAEETGPAGGAILADADFGGVEFSHDFAGARMLLADDIELNRMILREILADTQIEVTEASDGEEALKLFEASGEGHFDIVFMDIQMPNMDGYQAASAIRSLNRKDAASVVIMAMTANAMQKDVDQALAHGMNGHLAKPVDVEACLRAIAEALGRKTAR